MTKPKQGRAGKYLLKALETFSDDTPPEKTIEILLRCSDLADQDLDDCLTNEHKQKVWAALMSAVSMVIRSYNGKAAAGNALRDALINSSLSRPGDHGLTGTAMPNSKTIEKDWIRACVIALVDEYPKNRQKTYKDAVRVLGGSKDSLDKMRENYRAGKVGGPVLEHLVKTATQLIKEFEFKSLEDFLTP